MNETPRPDSAFDRNRPRIAFCGVGWIGRNRMEALVKSGCVEASAVADPSGKAIEEARRIAPGIAVARDIGELCALPCDGIVIATPSALHAKQAIMALQAKKSVFCQKPLGRTAAETSEAVEAARKNNRLLGVDLSYRFLAGAQTIKSLVQQGAIGDVYAVNAVFHNAYGPDKPWFYDSELSGGGCVIDLGIHLVDLVLWVLGFPKVTATCSKLFFRGAPLGKNAVETEDYAFVHADLEGGRHVSFDCSWNLPAGCDAVIQASFFGSGGGLSIRNVNGSFYDFLTQRFRGTASETLHSPPDDWGGRAAAAWARRLAVDNSFDPENERLIDVAAALDSMYHRGP